MLSSKKQYFQYIIQHNSHSAVKGQDKNKNIKLYLKSNATKIVT